MKAVDDVRSAVQGVRADLPGDLRDPIIGKINLSGSPILAYTIAFVAVIQLLETLVLKPLDLKARRWRR